MSRIDDLPVPVETQEYKLRRRSSATKRFRRRLRRATRWRTIYAALISVLVVVSVSGLVVFADASRRIESSVANLNQVLESVRSKESTDLTLADLERLQGAVGSLQRDLSIARREVAVLRPLAFVSSDVKIALEALDIAEELALAAGETLTGVEPALFFLVNGEEQETLAARGSSGERVAQLLRLGAGQFTNSRQRLENADERIALLPLEDASAAGLLRIESLAETQAELLEINQILLDGPDLLTAALGLSDEQNYIILAQNNDELRPSGGYVGTFGWMQVRDGRITTYNYSPTTTTAPNPPNATLASAFAVPDWWIQFEQPVYAAWDASWFADFSSTAEMARWFYDNGNNVLAPVDGVIAIDIVGFEYILEALEGVAVPAYNQVVTDENFRDVVYDMRASGLDERAHKQFIAEVYREIFDDWQSLNRDEERSAAVLAATLRGLREKHIMLNLADPDLNATLQLLGWGGVQTPALEHDYVLVADANMGNKSNRSVLRDLIYDVEILPDGALQSRVTAAYDYPARLAEADPAIDPRYHGPLDYSTLVQLFTPVGSALATDSDLQTPAQVVASETHTIFITRALVEYDGSERLQFSYTTPALIETIGPFSRYRLLLQKQPGTLAEPVTVQVTLPPGANIVATEPEAAATFDLGQPVLEFRLALETDQWVEVFFE